MKAIPDLFPCPDCGVPLQAGDGPHELAWHGCDRELGDESAIMDADLKVRAQVSTRLVDKTPLGSAETADLLLRHLVLRVQDGAPSVSEIAKAVSSLAELKEAEGEATEDDSLSKWLQKVREKREQQEAAGGEDT